MPQNCLFHKDWTPTVQDEAAAHNNFITLYGLFFQMKLFATAADPTKPTGDRDGCKPDGMRPVAIGEGTGFRSVCTNTYQLNFMEVPSGVKIILNTSPGAGNVRQILERFYREVFVALVVKDPVQQAGQVIENGLFEEEVDAFFRKTGFL